MTEVLRKTVQPERRAAATPRAAEPLPDWSNGKLPGPRNDAWDWRRLAACRGIDTDLFYGVDGEGDSDRSRRIKTAKAICEPCPVILECREFAKRTKEPYGIWGGLTPGERSNPLK